MKTKTLLVALTLFLAACGSMGDLGGTLGDILGSNGANDDSDVRGVVSSVDASNQRIYIDVQYVNNLRNDQSGQVIYYDSNTVVEFDGKRYTPTQLERGDEISVRGSNDNGRYVADTITVVRDVTR